MSHELIGSRSKMTFQSRLSARFLHLEGLCLPIDIWISLGKSFDLAWHDCHIRFILRTFNKSGEITTLVTLIYTAIY